MRDHILGVISVGVTITLGTFALNLLLLGLIGIVDLRQLPPKANNPCRILEPAGVLVAVIVTIMVGLICAFACARRCRGRRSTVLTAVSVALYIAVGVMTETLQVEPLLYCT